MPPFLSDKEERDAFFRRGGALYRVHNPIVLRGANMRLAPALRSRGPVPAGAGDERVFDPVQIGWLGAETHDDLDLDNADPLAPVADSLAALGLTLRPWRHHDAARMRTLLDDQAVWEHLPESFPSPLCAETVHQMIVAANMLDHHQVRAVIQSAQPIGQIRLEYGPCAPGAGVTDGLPLPPTLRPEAEISYWLGRARWGKGLGRALVAGTVARAFANAPGLLRLIAKVRPENAASRRILKGAGFSRIAPPAGRGFPDWDWFGLRRQHWAANDAQTF